MVLSLINFIGNFIINCLYIGKTFGLYFFNHIDTINLVSVNAVNKDVKALISIAKDLDITPLMLSATDFKNNNVRKNRDWENMKGRAVV